MNPFRKWLPKASSQDAPVSTAEDLQRGHAAVSHNTTAQGRLQRNAAVLIIVGLGAGMLTWYYSTAYSKVEAARTASRRGNTKADAESVLPPIKLPQVLSPPAPAAPSPYRIGSVLGESPLEMGEARRSTASTIPTNPASAAKTPQQLLEERLLAGAVFTHSRASDPASPADDAGDAATQPTTEASVSTTPLTTLLQSTAPQLVRASVLPTQRLLLPKGAFVDCTLETAIDSTLPGLATCLTAVDTFSADGTVVLLERGTKLIGETRGEVAQGASRLFVLWTEARTPRGVIVPLASPGTDELGRSGLPGKVDRHFMQRFGAAILVSVIDGAIQAAVASQAKAGSTVVNTGTTQDVLTEVLKSTINIPPTITKQQGDRIQILVARDLDFRSVYALASNH